MSLPEAVPPTVPEFLAVPPEAPPKAETKKDLFKEVTPEELAAGKNAILHRILKGITKVDAKELPKMLDIIQAEFQERKAKTGPGGEEKKEEFSREKALEALQGRKIEKKA